MAKWVVLMICLSVSGSIASQPTTDIKFERITTSNGLSNNQINDVFQDKQGYIWVGTLSGLNRYDGYNVKSFYHEEGNSETLENNTILWMAQGPEGNMWVRNSLGISVYNSSKETFDTPAKYLELLQTESVFISRMKEDAYGNFWFVVENRGLVKISQDGSTQQFNSNQDGIKIASNRITDLVADHTGNIWVVHSMGAIEVIDPRENKVIRRYGIPDIFSKKENYWRLFVDMDQDVWLFSTDDPFGLFHLSTRTGETRLLKEDLLTSELVRDIIQYGDGELWIGTDHGGISVLNKDTWKVSAVVNDPDVPKSLNNNNVNTLFRDKDGGVWIGTTKSGLNYHHRGANNFAHYKVHRKDPAFNDMSSMVEDRSGNLWIGTNGKGLLYFNRTNHTFQSVKEDMNIPGPKPEVVVSLLYDKNGILWVGSYLEGLFLYDGQRFSRLNFGNEDAESGSSVWELYEDSQGNVWIGTLNKGAYRYNPVTRELTNFSIQNELKANYVTCITEDQLGRIWLGTGRGLSLYDPRDELVRNFLSDDTVEYPISNNSIISLHSDSSGQLWVGTLDGLNRYDEDKNGFLVIRESDGLSSNIVMSIEESSDGDLWMSTSRGITRMSTGFRPYDFQTFDLSDGLQGDSFTEDASLKTRDGHLIFSGQNGFNIFRPTEIQVSEKAAKTFFTKLFVSNTEITTGTEFHDRVILTNPLEDTRDIYLRYDENTISIEFVALSFFQSSKLRYQYKLEGFDDEWLNTSPEMRNAKYTNLDFGEYTFRVRSSNNPNAWTGEDVFINIHISPPFWQTPWAFALYFSMIILALYLTRTYIVHRERQKAEVENERREIERQHQLDMMKIKFFTNISHEFRTPLSLVLTPIDRMIKNPEKIKVGDLTIVQRNAKRLMTLVNQLLDFRKMEANQHALSQSSGNIVAFLQDVADSFSDLSREKEIALNFETEVRSFYTFFDKDKMEKVMFNLLSNAFKFTLPGGVITIDFELQKGEEGLSNAVIMVTDTGIGIPEDKQQLIFNRFFQNEITGDIINNGTGIGLSITKEFVELHGGKVYVESKLNMGSTFVVELPLRELSSDEDIADELVRELAGSVNKSEEEIEPGSVLKPSVLLVEDNFDFRFYLKDNLKQHYNITVASNGKEAWKMMMHQLPDIVISDVMMPVMDGHQLCEKIKSDPRTLQIPVILLTAQSSDQHRVQGLDAGAIEYISKPFNFEILVSSINSALRFQRRVQESGSRIKATPAEVDIVSMDEKLIAKAVNLVEENMSNSDFSVEDLSHELGYSRGHFYQKILKITGQTPIDFIRNLRMKRAADLLERSQLNVSEVAYKVGYNNPKLFSRYFKSQYRVYPSEYRSKAEDSGPPVA
ncbi:two-component regulator propeller domain-containing protein [Marinoscillum sp.]|uniref:two-component regulator propeller domain-containing protein n=1 Tax=Marinoscillum sp. TaxID=2024838 RepID=UPI003BACAC8E